jgi:PAS domain S-box-containing protein
MSLSDSKGIETFALISEKITQLGDLKGLLDEILVILKKVTDSRHLAIRIIDPDGNLPFFSHLGLEKEFHDSEHWITLKDCLCGYVASGNVDKKLSFITDFGSFFTNSMTQFIEDRKKQKSKIADLPLRNVCSQHGYESIAIIPVKLRGKIIAELYFSDERKDHFSKQMISFLERLSSQIGIAIQNSKLYTELRSSQKKILDLFNATTFGIIEIDEKSTIIQINNAGARLLGYTNPQKILKKGIKISDLNVGKSRWESFLESINTKGEVSTEIITFQEEKLDRYLEFSLSSIKDAEGHTAGYRGTFRDKTDSVRLKEEKQLREETESLKKRYFQETQVLRDEIKTEYPFEEMIGTSPVMQQVKRAIQQVASTDTSVLIKGETGTGKELVARYIHELSLRRDRILVKVNCAALSEGLIASELFGHEKGAFTGAIQRRIGRFEYADKATIFLDEIGDLPLETQAMLLRILQDGEFERVGSSQTKKVDVRVLAATNRDLNLLVEEKKFREDLYFRLNVFPIEIPPLREKKDDIPLLSSYFLEVFGRKLGKKINRLSDDTLKLFMDYSWPGNVRELQNIIEHGLVISKGSALEVPQAYFRKTPESDEKKGLLTLDDHERQYIQKILMHTKGVIYGSKGAAQILGMKPSTLQSRMKKLDIKRNK